jgi:hypothetical protein
VKGSYLNDPCRELRTGEPDDDTSPPREGGPAACPRPCGECNPGHHFSDAMIDFADDGEEAPDCEAYEVDDGDKARAEATAAGCVAWYVCKHCDAWREWTVDAELDDDLGPEVSP